MKDEYLKLDFGDSSVGFLHRSPGISQDRWAEGFWCWSPWAKANCLPRADAAALASSSPTDFNAFLKIGEDGRVSCFTGKIEMGQGIFTSLAQMLADELNVPLESVDMVMGDTELCPWDMGTFGSMSTRVFGPALRAAAAEARAVLVQLAEERLQIPAAQLKAENGAVFVKDQPEKKASYAELTKGKRIERRIGSEGGAGSRLRVHDRRKARFETGRAGQGDRQSEIRGRHPLARHALGSDPKAAGPRRHVQKRGHFRGRKSTGRAHRKGGRVWWPRFTSIRTLPKTP